MYTLFTVPRLHPPSFTCKFCFCLYYLIQPTGLLFIFEKPNFSGQNNVVNISELFADAINTLKNHHYRINNKIGSCIYL